MDRLSDGWMDRSTDRQICVCVRACILKNISYDMYGDVHYMEMSMTCMRVCGCYVRIRYDIITCAYDMCVYVYIMTDA